MNVPLLMTSVRTIEDLCKAFISFTADDFPTFTYAKGTFDPDHMLEGRFMHPLPIKVGHVSAGYTS
jgi:hypothetical protein